MLNRSCAVQVGCALWQPKYTSKSEVYDSTETAGFLRWQPASTPDKKNHRINHQRPPAKPEPGDPPTFRPILNLAGCVIVPTGYTDGMYDELPIPAGAEDTQLQIIKPGTIAASSSNPGRSRALLSTIRWSMSSVAQKTERAGAPTLE